MQNLYTLVVRLDPSASAKLIKAVESVRAAVLHDARRAGWQPTGRAYVEIVHDATHGALAIGKVQVVRGGKPCSICRRARSVVDAMCSHCASQSQASRKRDGVLLARLEVAA
jgi:hypothetical protein